MDIKSYITEMNKNYFRNGTYHAVKNPEYNSTSGNHAIINAIHYTIVDRSHALTEEDMHTADSYIKRCEQTPGIYNRAPDKFDHQAHDDYIGICTTSQKLFLKYAQIIYAYGQKHWYYFDNTPESTKFEIKNWHGRFPWLTFYYKYAAVGHSCTIFQQLAFGLYLYLNTFNKDKTDTSGRILRWIMKESVKGHYKLVDFFINIWENDILEKYEDGMGDVLGIYYGVDHPFSIIMKGQV